MTTGVPEQIGTGLNHVTRKVRKSRRQAKRQTVRFHRRNGKRLLEEAPRRVYAGYFL